MYPKGAMQNDVIDSRLILSMEFYLSMEFI